MLRSSFTGVNGVDSPWRASAHSKKCQSSLRCRRDGREVPRASIFPQQSSQQEAARSTMASSTHTAPLHGFDDIVGTANTMGSMLSNFDKNKLMSSKFLKQLWSQAHGANAPNFQRVLVVGNRATLNKWAPFSKKKKYPKFIQECTYKGRRESDVNGEGEQEREQQLVDVQDGDVVVLLPGEYDVEYLWDQDFNGTNLVLGLDNKGESNSCGVMLYSRKDGPMVTCHGKTCIANVVMHIRNRVGGECATVKGSLRMYRCCVGAFFDFNTGDLVTICEGGAFFAENVVLGPSTASCIKCQGQCFLLAHNCIFQTSGRGDVVQRISKVTGKFPSLLRGVRPAIAVSYAATIKMLECRFLKNFGYPVQYASKEDFDGRERDAVEMTLCTFERNCRSPFLPRVLPDTTFQARVEPWFSNESKVAELVDIETATHPIERLYLNNEAVGDRNAFTEIKGYLSNDVPTAELSPPAQLLVRMAGHEILPHKVQEYFVAIYKNSSPWDVFVKQRNCEREGLPTEPVERFREFEGRLDKDATAYGIMDDSQRHLYYYELAQKIIKNYKQVCNIVEPTLRKWIDESELSDAKKLLVMCWGSFTVEGTLPLSLVRVTEVIILALHYRNKLVVSSYHAECLVEQLQCESEESNDTEKCFCNTTSPPTYVMALLLGMSQSSVADALFDLLRNAAATGHGRRKAGRILTSLAILKRDFSLRTLVAKEVSLLIRNDDSLTPSSRSVLIAQLSCLRAIECTKDVREGCSRFEISVDTCGYLNFLMRCGLHVNLRDEVVQKEVLASGTIAVIDAYVTGSDKESSKAKYISQREKMIARHNAAIAGKLSPPCDHCGKHPPDGDEFPVCTGCKSVVYCGVECQRAAWKDGHKNVCKARSNGSAST